MEESDPSRELNEPAGQVEPAMGCSSAAKSCETEKPARCGEFEATVANIMAVVMVVAGASAYRWDASELFWMNILQVPAAIFAILALYRVVVGPWNGSAILRKLATIAELVVFLLLIRYSGNFPAP